MHTSFVATGQDEAVLVEVGEFLGSLARRDLNDRIRLGKGPKHLGRKERKRALTPQTSGRWASAITRRTADLFERGMENLLAVRDRDVRKIYEISQRMKARGEGKDESSARKGRGRRKSKPKPVYRTINGVRQKVASGRRRKTYKPYPTKEIKEQKNLRLHKLLARHADTVKRLEEGRPSITVGGKDLAKRRHNLDDDPAMTHEEWLLRWRMSRLFLTADGDSGYSGGNQTIKVVPGDSSGSEPGCHKIVMRLPSALAHLSNTASSVPSYEFSGAVRWGNKRLSPVWEQRMAGRRSVGYTIKWVDARWRLECSWANDAPSEEDQPSLRGLRSGRVLAVDFNADHFACSVLDEHGNAVGAPVRFLFCLDGSTQRRRGVLAAALQEMLSHAQHEECRSLVVENLGFGDIKEPGREHGGFGKRGKRYRKMLHNFPTAVFGSLLISMVAANDFVEGVIVIDPAYTSRWGKQHCFAHMNSSRRWEYSGHDVAAYVIGRRGLGYGAKRRCQKVPPDRSIRGKQSDVGRSTTARTSSSAGKEEPTGEAARPKTLPFARKRDEQALPTVRSAERWHQQPSTQN